MGTASGSVAGIIEYAASRGGGSIRLIVRDSPNGNYAVDYDPSGQVTLYRGDIALATAFVAASTVWDTNTLKVSAITEHLRVSFNNQEIINFHDTEPLPCGAIRFRGVFSTDDPRSVLRIDTFTISLNNSELPLIDTQSRYLSLLELPSISTSLQAFQLSDITAPLDDHIVYAIWQGGSAREEIFVRDLDTSTSSIGTPLIARDGSLEGFPRLSPNGERLVFMSSIGANNDTYQNLYLVNLTQNILDNAPILDSGWVPLVPDTTPGQSSTSPSWSPIGDQIAFQSNRGGQGWKIWIINADGTGLRRLTNNPTNISEFSPTWSPDGSQIAYVVGGCGSDRDIYITRFC